MAKRRGYETVRLADVTKAVQVQGPNRRPADTRGPNLDDVRKADQQKVEELGKVATSKSVG